MKALKLKHQYLSRFGLLILMLFLSATSVAGTPGVEFGLHFDEQGNIIRPDEVFLGRGLKDDEDGYKDEALRNLKISATYGNAYAKYFIGLLYLQKNDYVSAFAWFNLLDKEFKGADKINALLPKVESNLNQSQLKLANEKVSELKETYGEYAALMKREKWRKSHRYTGTHIPGHIPNFLKIDVGNGMTVSGHEVRKQIETFVYEYEFQFRLGEVNLKETEYIDGDSTSESVESDQETQN